MANKWRTRDHHFLFPVHSIAIIEIVRRYPYNEPAESWLEIRCKHLNTTVDPNQAYHKTFDLTTELREQRDCS